MINQSTNLIIDEAKTMGKKQFLPLFFTLNRRETAHSHFSFAGPQNLINNRGFRTAY